MPAADKQALDGTAKADQWRAAGARGFGVVGELVAEPHVLKEILRNAGASGKGAAKGGPMQLFERWIALAVPTGATDLHIEVRRNVAIVRMRVDGRIEPLPDGQGGRYSRKEVVDAIAAGYNSTRKVEQCFPVQRRSIRRLHDRPRPAGAPQASLRYQNVKGLAGAQDGGAHPAHRRRETGSGFDDAELRGQPPATAAAGRARGERGSCSCPA